MAPLAAGAARDLGPWAWGRIALAWQGRSWESLPAGPAKLTRAAQPEDRHADHVRARRRGVRIVYAGHWLDPAKDLVNRSRDALAARPVWLFSSGPVGDPSSKLSQAMGKDPVDVAGLRAATHARDHRMFAGQLDRKLLSRPQRAALLVCCGLEGDFRDWAEIRQWAGGIAQQLARRGLKVRFSEHDLRRELRDDSVPVSPADRHNQATR